MNTFTQKWTTCLLNFALIEEWQKIFKEVEIVEYTNYYINPYGKIVPSTAIVKFTK